MVLKVKLFDEDHEADLEESINAFLENKEEDQIKSIQYQVATMKDDEQIFCFSAMIVYRE